LQPNIPGCPLNTIWNKKNAAQGLPNQQSLAKNIFMLNEKYVL
jgi:hypothetical protein